jgi:hypothetical protein
MEARQLLGQIDHTKRLARGGEGKVMQSSKCAHPHIFRAAPSGEKVSDLLGVASTNGVIRDVLCFVELKY